MATPHDLVVADHAPFSGHPVGSSHILYNDRDQSLRAGQVRDSTSSSQDSQEGSRSREAIHPLLERKSSQWKPFIERKRPLQLLDLPLDILREIISQLPHTNDLTSLALCHSVFHSLCIPCIYARFDIVWPDINVDTTSRAGVDALTFGLATLVMAEEVFSEAPWQRRMREEHAALHGRPVRSEGYPVPKRRRGNNYAQFTKKFSLGNGPAEWVQEYLITKEGGKMLGTLVALAVARMHNLEVFVWDMPTGVLRDIWLALSSLAERDDGQDCRLEKVWVRWHNNLEDSLSLGTIPPPQLNPLPTVQPPHISNNAIDTPVTQVSDINQRSIESPNFSVLPPLKSINVLDIDELHYLDEMSILIARSQSRLKELRVGVAAHVHRLRGTGTEWCQSWDGEDVQQVDYDSPWGYSARIPCRRLGGVLGILVGRVYNLRNNARTQRRKSLARVLARDLASNLKGAIDSNHIARSVTTAGATTSTFHDAVSTPLPPSPPELASSQRSLPLRPARSSIVDLRKDGPYLNGRLEVEVLALERVPLSIPVLTYAFDWSQLTSLTILGCQNHESLWRLLRKQFSPVAQANKHTRFTKDSPQKLHYGLRLKTIHTDNVSSSLISLLKDTLAPNSLEVLFLQEAANYNSNVSIDTIFKGPVKRHRISLRKLSVDSSGGNVVYVDTTIKWRRWMLTREAVSFLTSGKLENLRELGITLDYRDWHYFLQSLPQIPRLRSLYIPRLADHPHGSNIDPKDLVMQLVDIVALRPELQLCYVGMMSKCFEILEIKRQNRATANRSPEQSAFTTGAVPILHSVANVPPPVILQDPNFSDEEDREVAPVAVVSASGTHDASDSENADEDTAAVLPALLSNIHIAPPEDMIDIPRPAFLETSTTPPLQLHDPGVAHLPLMPQLTNTQNDNASETTNDDGSIDSDDNDDNDTLNDTNDDEYSTDELDTDTSSDSENLAPNGGADGLFSRRNERRRSSRRAAGPRLSLREILFYDDKVAVFKARHGRL